MKESLTAISAIFLNNIFNLPALYSTYLTLLDAKSGAMDVVSNSGMNFDNPHIFSFSGNSKLNFSKFTYSDNYINTINWSGKKSLADATGSDQNMSNDGSNNTNYLIHFNPIKGDLRHQDVPEIIPKSFIQNSMSKDLSRLMVK
jgi:hypothetical protein